MRSCLTVLAMVFAIGVFHPLAHASFADHSHPSIGAISVNPDISAPDLESDHQDIANFLSPTLFAEICQSYAVEKPQGFTRLASADGKPALKQSQMSRSEWFTGGGAPRFGIKI